MPINLNGLPSDYFINKPGNMSGVQASSELTPLGLLNAYQEHQTLDAKNKADIQNQIQSLTNGRTLSPADPNYSKVDYLTGILNGQRTTSPFTKFMQDAGIGAIGLGGAGILSGALPGATGAFGSSGLFGGSGASTLAGDAGNDLLEGGVSSSTLGAGATAGGGNFLTNLISKIPGLSSLTASTGGAGSLGNSLLISSLLSGAGSIYGANAASNAQKQAIQGANTKLQPFVDTGYGANTALNNLITNPQTGLENLPGYQFTLNQGLKAVQNDASARGLGVSGYAQKGAANFATGLANSTYGDQFNRLLNLSSQGQNAATGVGNNLIQGGNASAANYNTQGAAISGIGSANTLATLLPYLAAQQGNNSNYLQR